MSLGATASFHELTATSRLSRDVWLVVAAITLAGTCLRVAAARGNLWLDEIWTFRLLETVRHPGDILFALPNDNNHVLTTLWLWFVGPHAVPLLVRLPAIVYGTLTAPVAAWIFARQGTGPTIIAASLFAFDYAFVHFGSEARGYSGLILAALVAYGAVDAMLADGVTAWRQSVFALAIVFGTFSHLTMVEVTGVLCGWAIVTQWRRQGRVEARRAIVSIGLPALAGTLPPLLCLAISLTSGPLHTGFLTPFTVTAFEAGLSRMAGATLGLPDIDVGAAWTAVLLVAGAAASIAALPIVPARRRALYALALLGLPAMHIALRLPNQQYPRFHLTVAIVLALLCIDLWAVAWRRAPRLAVAAAGIFLLAQAAVLARFIDQGRGRFADAVAAMEVRGAATVAAEPAVRAGETRAVVRWHAGPSLRAEADVTCATLPDWLIVAAVPYEHQDLPSARPFGPAACPALYTRTATYPAYGLSGFAWTLYRRP